MAARRRARPGPFTTAVVVAVIGVAGTAVAAIVGNWDWPPDASREIGPPSVTPTAPATSTPTPNPTPSPKPQEAILELLGVVSVGTPEEPRLELKLLNIGEEVAFITRVDLTITYAFSVTFSGGQVTSSATYELELPLSLNEFPTTIHEPLSHRVLAHSEDQITLSLGVPARNSAFVHHYFLTVTMLYNGTETNASQELEVVINGRDPGA